jgi:NAD(P)-dependent dehydrogenase (short-subunit alcohol dehydrogenase family)
MSLGIEGQTAIVTGGARGIGLGIAQRLAKEGAQIILWDLDFSVFDPVVAGFLPIRTDVVDVTNVHTIEKAVAAAMAQNGRIDILVNNAGINGPILSVADCPVDVWTRILTVDLTSVFLCCRTVVPHMVARKYGRIVNIASIAGKEGNARGAAYSAAKAGVIGFTKSLAKELVETGVLVNAVAPAIAETDLFAQMTPEHITAMKAKIPMNRFVRIPEIAATVAWAASPECSFTTGFTFDVTGGRATY